MENGNEKNNLANYLGMLTGSQQGSSFSKLGMGRVGTSTIPILVEDDDDVSSQISDASSVLRNDLETLLQKIKSEEAKEMSATISGIEKAPNLFTNQNPKKAKRKELFNQSVREDKRNRTDAIVTPQADKKANTSSGAIQKKTPCNPSYKEVIAPVKVGFESKHFPRKTLERDEINQLRKEVLKLIFDQRNLSVEPRFTQEPTVKAWGLIFYCANTATAHWLKNQEEWKKRDLVPINEQQFPSGYVFVLNFEHSSEYETEFILGMIDGQNNGLEASSWKVLNRKNNDHVALITVETNEATFETLKKADFLIHYAYGQKIKWELKKVIRKVTKPEPSTSSNSNPTPESGNQNEVQPSTSSGIAVKPSVNHRQQ